MEYHLQIKTGDVATPKSMTPKAYKEPVWKDYGYKTASLFEIKQKIEYAKKALGNSVELRYVARPRVTSFQNFPQGYQLF